jgi:uncharacterized membrane protein YgdD (TMEM256/DUF423 family)
LIVRRALEPPGDTRRRLHGLAASAALLLLALTLGASAHHSFAAYDEDREIRLEGTLAAFDFVNPHARVTIDVEDANGNRQRWRAEWAGAGTLLGQGVAAGSLATGDTLVLTGNPARDPGGHALRLTSLLRPADGFGWGFSGETSD